MLQQIITYSFVVSALVFLAYRFFFKRKKKDDCGPDCNCG